MTDSDSKKIFDVVRCQVVRDKCEDQCVRLYLYNQFKHEYDFKKHFFKIHCFQKMHTLNHKAIKSTLKHFIEINALFS